MTAADFFEWAFVTFLGSLMLLMLVGLLALFVAAIFGGGDGW